MRKFLLLSFCFFLAIWAGYAQLNPPAGVNIGWYVGHESDLSFTITEPGELAGVSWLVQNEHTDFENQTIFLGRNIDLEDWIDDYGDYTLSSSGWIPIGLSIELSFSGSFIGNGYTISGLWMESEDINNRGLFGSITQAGTVSNLVVEVAERGISGGMYIGGLAGFNAGTIVNCVVKLNSSGNSVVSGVFCTGGLVGYNEGYIRQSYSTVKVEGTTNTEGDGYDTGGLVGSNNGSITNCYATGEVQGVGYVGGLVGFNESDIFHAYALGTVSGPTGVGGLVGGQSNPTGNIANSFFTDAGSDNGFGALKTSNEMKDPSTFVDNGWDFHYAWGIDTNPQNPFNAGLPYLNAPIEDIDTSWFDEEQSTFTITTPEQLAGVAMLSYLGEYFQNKTITLGNDIDLSAWLTKNKALEGWTPITYFLGTFDGNNKTISGLWINKPYYSRVGLFGQNDSDGDASIRNLTVVVDNKDHSGIVGKSIIGGLVGWNSGTIFQCAVLMEDKTAIAVYGLNDKTGGLVGDNSGNISESYTAVKVKGRWYAGGLLGSNFGIVDNCYTIGSTEGTEDETSDGIGGLVGTNADEESVIQYSYSIGVVEGHNTVGALVGTNTIRSVIISSYYDESVNIDLDGVGENNGTGDAIGTPSLAMKQSGTFTDWDYNGIWMLDNSDYQTINHGYPYLQWVVMKNIELTLGDNFSYKVNGTTVTSDNHILPVDPYGDFVFTIIPASGYTAANAVVKANNQQLSVDNNTYTLDPVFSDSTITVTGITRALHHIVNIITENGIILNPSADTYAVETGSTFTFYITLEEGYEGRTPQVTVNGEPVNIQLRPNGAEWTYTIGFITGDVNVVVSLAVTANEQVHTATYYSRDGQLVVETVAPTRLAVYTLTGQAVVSRTVPSGLTTIPLSAGVYIIKIDETAGKVIIRK